MLSICTLPMSPAKNSSSVTAALINLRAGRRTSSLESLRNEDTEIKGVLCSNRSAMVTSDGCWPVGVFWVGPGHIVLQLHVGLFLKALYLWGVIYAWVVWYRKHTHMHTVRTKVSFLWKLEQLPPYQDWRAQWLLGRHTRRHQGRVSACCCRTPAFSKCAPWPVWLALLKVSL